MHYGKTRHPSSNGIRIGKIKPPPIKKVSECEEEMNFTKAERLTMLAAFFKCYGEGLSIQLLGRERMEKLKEVDRKVIGSLTLNEVQKLGPITFEKLANSLLDSEE